MNLTLLVIWSITNYYYYLFNIFKWWYAKGTEEQSIMLPDRKNRFFIIFQYCSLLMAKYKKGALKCKIICVSLF